MPAPYESKEILVRKPRPIRLEICNTWQVICGLSMITAALMTNTFYDEHNALVSTFVKSPVVVKNATCRNMYNNSQSFQVSLPPNARTEPLPYTPYIFVDAIPNTDTNTSIAQYTVEFSMKFYNASTVTDYTYPTGYNYLSSADCNTFAQHLMEKYTWNRNAIVYTRGTYVYPIIVSVETFNILSVSMLALSSAGSLLLFSSFLWACVISYEKKPANIGAIINRARVENTV